jgi:hypothetical protein
VKYIVQYLRLTKSRTNVKVLNLCVYVYLLQRFDSWILLPAVGKKRARGQKAYLLGPLVELASDQV